MLNHRVSTTVTLRIGLVALSLGLLFRSIVDPSAWIGETWAHGITGFLVGVSIPILLTSLWAKSHPVPKRQS